MSFTGNAFVADVAVCVLAFIVVTVGVLWMTGKAKLVIVHEVKGSSQPEGLPVEPLLLTPPKRKRVRPRKETKPRTRHLYLPTDMTESQLNGLLGFFRNHQDTAGDKVILHVPSHEGPDRDIEIPFLVTRSSHLKENLATVLPNWA